MTFPGIHVPCVYVVVWSGGYEMPQYFATYSEAMAWRTAVDWAADMEEGAETVDVLKISLDLLTIEHLPRPSDDELVWLFGGLNV